MCEGSVWETRPIEEVAVEIIDYRGKSPRKCESGIPLVTAKIVKNGRIDPPTEFIPESDYYEWMRRGIPEPGDVVITTEAPLGEVAQLGPEKVALAQRLIVLRARPDLMANRFLKYALVSSAVQHQLHARATGTTVLGIKQSELRKVEIPIPPLPTQRRIAHVLGTLDDKIELNRRMNWTLEAIARAIFKSWFVDFDPVHAKAEGREPVGMDSETAALFPDSFQDSPLGKIPKGWRIGKLDSLLALSRESIKPLKYPNEEFDYFSIPAFDAGEPSRDSGDTIRSSKYMVPSLAVLISKLNPHLPRVWFPQVSDVRRAICSTEFLVCVPKSGVPREYVYGLLSSRTFLDRFAQLVTGTTGSHQRVHPATFLKMNTVLPTQDLCGVIARNVRPMLRECAALLIESRELAETREALLPELLAGRFA